MQSARLLGEERSGSCLPFFAFFEFSFLIVFFSLFLHLYQPPTQDPKIILEVSRRSYARLVELLLKYPQAKVTLNLTGSLLEQWLEMTETEGKRQRAGNVAPKTEGKFSVTAAETKLLGDQIIGGFQELAKRGQVELTGTAMYHPLLPTLPVAEMARQIELDLAIKRGVFGPGFRPAGFFPPEMVYTPDLARVVEQMGFEWIILDESAHPLSSVRQEKKAQHAALHLGDAIYQIAGTNLKVFFRDREASLKVAFSDRLLLSDFLSNYPTIQRPRHLTARPANFLLLAMDGETFGHHRPGMLEWLEELFAGDCKLLTLSELLSKDFPVRSITPVTSTWGVTIEESDQARTFPRWQNPGNPVHALQWKLYQLALRVGEQLPAELEGGGWRVETGSDGLDSQKPDALLARELLDKALHSDQFWWGSHAPCWNLDMVKKGAVLLRDSVLLNPKSTLREKDEAQDLFGKILAVGKKEYGEKVIGC